MMIRPVQAGTLKARLFRSLADERRLAILACLCQGEQRVGDVVSATALSQSTVSTDLSALHAAGLVSRRADGRQVWYTLAHPSVLRVLEAAEEVVLAALAEAYACASPCCST